MHLFIAQVEKLICKHRTTSLLCHLEGWPGWVGLGGLVWCLMAGL